MPPKPPSLITLPIAQAPHSGPQAACPIANVARDKDITIHARLFRTRLRTSLSIISAALALNASISRSAGAELLARGEIEVCRWRRADDCDIGDRPGHATVCLLLLDAMSHRVTGRYSQRPSPVRVRSAQIGFLAQPTGYDGAFLAGRTARVAVVDGYRKPLIYWPSLISLRFITGAFVIVARAVSILRRRSIGIVTGASPSRASAAFSLLRAPAIF